MTEALFYEKLENSKVRCEVCEHHCLIAPGKTGICKVRENQNGKLIALNYGKIIATHIDPIEKKPLYHFIPGTLTYSIATVGCNFHCLHCQNADISQLKNKDDIVGKEISPEEIVQAALNSNCPSISYTYTEPTIFVEFALDTMKLAQQQGLKNIWVSNGYMSAKTLKAIVPYLDAINVDLKSFSNEFYNKICGAKLQPVLNNLVKINQAGIHLEITTLIIPGKNDSAQELKSIAKFIVQKLDPETPWHVSRFFPTYKMLDYESTPKQKIFEAVEIGKQAGLKNIHPGNI